MQFRNHTTVLGTLRAVAGKLADDETPGRAAQMAFCFFLSLFPNVVIVMAAASTFADAQRLVRNAVPWWLDETAPCHATTFFAPLLDALAQRPGVSWFWALVALWAASSGMAATVRGLKAATAATTGACGPIGTVIVLLLWLHLTGIAILAGATVNARLERSEGA